MDLNSTNFGNSPKKIWGLGGWVLRTSYGIFFETFSNIVWTTQDTSHFSTTNQELREGLGESGLNKKNN